MVIGRGEGKEVLYTLRLTNMEMENPLFVEESSLPRGNFPLPC